MADLIERDAALAYIDCCLGNSLGGRKEFDSGLMQARKFVTSIPAVNRWIPCSERLPESNISVLCAMRTGEYRIMEYDEEEHAWYEGIHDYRKHCVTYWMPLPEPPEKE